MSWGYYQYFTPSRPIDVKGGIKAQSKTFGKSWWAKRWIQVLESFNIGERLNRGRTYARRGQVTDLRIEEGLVKAKVQGSRPTPYAVTIKVKTIAEWKKLGNALRQEAIFFAKLLAGEMPDDIELIFRKNKLSLFPQHLNDLETECSCPDWSNPCKHIAAVYYLIGEEFDRAPFLILKLRGIPHEKLLGNLGEEFSQEKNSKNTKSKKQKLAQQTDSSESENSNEEKNIHSEPLPADPAAFWNDKIAWNNYPAEVTIPPESNTAPLLARLGNFPFWRGTSNLRESLTPIYTTASKRGLSLFFEERVDNIEPKI